MAEEVQERRQRGRPRNNQSPGDGGSVQSLERAIALLRVIADADESIPFRLPGDAARSTEDARRSAGWSRTHSHII